MGNLYYREASLLDTIDTRVPENELLAGLDSFSPSQSMKFLHTTVKNRDKMEQLLSK